MHKLRKQAIVTLVLCTLAFPSFAILPANGYVTQTGMAAGVIVQMRNDHTPTTIAKAGGQPRLSKQVVAEMNVVAAIALTFKRTASLGSQVLNFSQPISVADAQAIAERLMTMPDVEYAIPNLIFKPSLTPDDPRFVDGTQWALNSPTAGANLPTAWDFTTGSNTIPIAVIDTGYTNHSELPYSSFATDGYDMITDSTEAGDGDGRDSDARDEGDYCAADSTSSSWHGTAVMSIIGALTNNNTLMAGINWHAKLIPVRMLGRCGGTLDDLIDSIRWAAGLSVSGIPDNPNPAKVINMSLGAIGACDAMTQAAINDAHAAGAVLIAAAGNEALPASNSVPANCDHVMAIASHDLSGDISYFSNYGDTVALSAPGEAIYVATCNSPTDYTTTTENCENSSAVTVGSGTSLSAPMASGVASLLFDMNAKITNVYVEEILRNSTRSFVADSSCIGVCGSGMLDAGIAMANVSTFTTEDNNFVTPAQQVQISQDGGGGDPPILWIVLVLLVWIYRYFIAVGTRRC